MSVPQASGFPLNQAEQEAAAAPPARRHTWKGNAPMKGARGAAGDRHCGGPPCPSRCPCPSRPAQTAGPRALRLPLGLASGSSSGRQVRRLGAPPWGPPEQGWDGLGEPLPSPHSPPSPGPGTAPTSGAHPCLKLSPLSWAPCSGTPRGSAAPPTRRSLLTHPGRRQPGGGNQGSAELALTPASSQCPPTTPDARFRARSLPLASARPCSKGLLSRWGARGSHPRTSQPEALPRGKWAPSETPLAFSWLSCRPPFPGCPTPAPRPPWSRQAI